MAVHFSDVNSDAGACRYQNLLALLLHIARIYLNDTVMKVTSEK